MSKRNASFFKDINHIYIYIYKQLRCYIFRPQTRRKTHNNDSVWTSDDITCIPWLFLIVRWRGKVSSRYHKKTHIFFIHCHFNGLRCACINFLKVFFELFALFHFIGHIMYIKMSCIYKIFHGFYFSITKYWMTDLCSSFEHSDLP